jgi:hypothetical protein
MAQSEEQAGRSAAREPSANWLIAPQLSPGARLQISGVIDAEQLTPDVLNLLAKFMKDLEQIERSAPPVETCPKLQSCDDYHHLCPELNWCGKFWVKAVPF